MSNPTDALEKTRRRMMAEAQRHLDDLRASGILEAVEGLRAQLRTLALPHHLGTAQQAHLLAAAGLQRSGLLNAGGVTNASLHQAVEAYTREQGKWLAQLNQPWLKAFQEQLASLDSGVLAINRQVAEYAATLQPQRELARQFLKNLPDLREWQRLLQQAEKGEDVLKETGLGFAGEHLALTVMVSLGRTPQQVLHPVATTTLRTYTLGPAFEEELREVFEASRVVRRRWPIVRSALGAHRRREYTLSVPALLAQIEGMVADALIFRQLVVRRGSKIYRLDAAGKILKNAKGDRAEVKGLDPLIRQSGYQNDPALKDLALHIVDRIAPMRNGVLHGGRTDYGTAKESVRALLVIRVLCEVFRQLEGLPR